MIVTSFTLSRARTNAGASRAVSTRPAARCRSAASSFTRTARTRHAHGTHTHTRTARTRLPPRWRRPSITASMNPAHQTPRCRAACAARRVAITAPDISPSPPVFVVGLLRGDAAPPHMAPHDAGVADQSNCGGEQSSRALRMAPLTRARRRIARAGRLSNLGLSQGWPPPQPPPLPLALSLSSQ